MSLIGTVLIAFLSIIVPGFFLSLALLRKTKLNMFEITVIGFIFGLIFPPTLTWLEAYFMDYVHFFSFSAALYGANVVLLTIAGIALSYWQGALNLDFLKPRPKPVAAVAAQMHRDYKERISELRQTMSLLNLDLKLVKDHEREESDLARKHEEEMRKLRDAGPEERSKIEETHRDEEKRLMESHEREEKVMIDGGKPVHNKTDKPAPNLIWLALLALMLLAFGTRMLSIGVAPKFFEFDPYFDMQSTEFLLTHGYQWLYDHSAWPTEATGSIHRVEPIVPYLEAYWYQISNPPTDHIDLTLLTYVSAVYPPIMAALLVFVIFLFLYHAFGPKSALIGAALAVAMPALITTFIAGEQLLQPWGIFTMFLFYATYMLAAQDPKDKRYAILAGVAFAATFLGAHYYTVNAGVLAIYIGLQGIVNVLRNEKNMDFYKMNAILVGVIVLFYLAFEPYSSVLSYRIPEILGIPVIISFPLLALLFVAVLDYLPALAKRFKLIDRVNLGVHLALLALLAVLALLLVLFTPLGSPVTRYIALSTHFTTPSIPLFMTVQEYAPTGFNFDFGSGGFGIIGASIAGVNIVVWTVLVVFSALSLYAIYKRNSKSSILIFAALTPLAVAGMIEVKYLPHFGVGYVLAIGAILGELFIIAKEHGEAAKKALLAVAVAIVFLEVAFTLIVHGPALNYNLYHNVIADSWLMAGNWMYNNVGPAAPRVLSWWDYGDWINWFGNSNAVLRGDNSDAKLDYAVAGHFVMGSGDSYGPAELASFMDGIQSKYVLFDDQLTQKWQALNFLACINANLTSKAYALQAAKGTNSPYVLGTSQCELSHSPAYLFVPISTSSIGNYCQIPGSNVTALKAIMVVGNSFSNQTFCVPLSSTSNQTRLLTPNGTETNAFIVPTSQFYFGTVSISGQQFADFMMLYSPDGPNDTITNAPTAFYNSNYYRGFYLGKLPGFSIAYPSNFTGINYVNGDHPVVIYRLDNYTGGLPPLTPKPAWVVNNFTMPG
ncbi:Uncharacterised protein [uncultured archaeon]|nr:Uncharacterised protein [uncultured archaeon]